MEQRNETGGLVLTSAPTAAALFCKPIILVKRQWLAKAERTGPRKRCLLLLLSFAGSEGRFKSYGNFGLPPKQRRVLVCVWGYEVLASVCLPLELFWCQPCLLYVEEIRSMVGMPDSRIPRALWKFWTKRNTIERERTSRAKDNRRHSWNIVCCAITAGEICLQSFPNESPATHSQVVFRAPWCLFAQCTGGLSYSPTITSSTRAVETNSIYTLLSCVGLLR